jgi:hypothetical protein
MRWKIQLIAEAATGETTEAEVATIEREDLLSPATTGLTIAEGKTILESLQKRMVAAQVEHHGASMKACLKCGAALRTKGHYNSMLRTVYGNVPMRVRRLRGCACAFDSATRSTVFTNHNPVTPELKYLTAKLAALMPFGKVGDFLSELLPLSAKAAPGTIRNRTMRVGRRLQNSAEALAVSARREPCERAVVGLDGGYVRSRHRRPEYNFEVVAGKVLDQEGSVARFAFVRDGGSVGESAAGLAMRRSGVNESTSVTVLTDGDAGLRAIQRRVAPEAKHVLDWFHVGMRFENLKQVAKGINGLTDGALRNHALAEIERAKWRFWNGYAERGIIGLVHLAHWAAAQCFDHLPSLKKLSKSLLDVIRYLESNSDSIPDYGERYRAGSRISTGFAESAVNEIIAKRMAKKQKMRWNRYTVQRFLDVRVHVLNGTLEDAFRHWHRGFRPIPTPGKGAAAA